MLGLRDSLGVVVELGDPLTLKVSVEEADPPCESDRDDVLEGDCELVKD